MAEMEHVDPEFLHATVTVLHEEGYRLVQMHCRECTVGVHEGNELIYTFDKDLKLRNLHMLLPRGFECDSVSDIYPYAFLYENEMKDLFGVEFCNLSIDFKGTLYQMDIKTPMRTVKDGENHG